MHIYESTP